MRMPLLMREVRRQRPETVAEIGPGLGDFAIIALDSGVPDLTLFETSSAAAEKLRERFSATSVRVHEGEISSAFASSFDMVVACEVLEHVEEDENLLCNIRRALKTDGVLVGSVPAFMSKWQQVDDYAGHLRRYEQDELERKLRDAGFVDIRIRNYGFPLTNLLYPVREAYYRTRNWRERLDVAAATARSGVDRPHASRWTIMLIRLIVAILLPLQALSSRSQLGDGFIFFARRDQ